MKQTNNVIIINKLIKICNNCTLLILYFNCKINLKYIYIFNNEGRNKCFKYNTTQNDRGSLYLLFIYKSKQKTIH